MYHVPIICFPLVSDQRPVTETYMERVHLIKKVYPDSTRLCYLFWSEFTGTSIEYRYNYLFTHKSRADTSSEAYTSVQGTKLVKRIGANKKKGKKI